MTLPSIQPAPIRTPITGLVSPEWVRWFDQIRVSGSTTDSNSTRLAALTAEIAVTNTALAAVQTQLSAVRAITFETNGGRNGSQSKFNLVAGSHITLAEDGAGDVTITAAAPTLNTNGLVNGSQSTLNLMAGANITLADDGIGDVTITAAALTLDTNGVLNGSQSKLNLVAGANITLADDGIGDVTITAANAPAAVSETPAGTMNGTNTSFTLSFTPTPSASLTLFLNGVAQRSGTDYTRTGAAITYVTAPKSTDLMSARYTH
jgi:hypothetical protein